MLNNLIEYFWKEERNLDVDVSEAVLVQQYPYGFYDISYKLEGQPFDLSVLIDKDTFLKFMLEKNNEFRK